MKKKKCAKRLILYAAAFATAAVCMSGCGHASHGPGDFSVDRHVLDA